MQVGHSDPTATSAFLTRISKRAEQVGSPYGGTSGGLDVHRQDSTLDAGTDRKEYPGHIGIISRFMRLVVRKHASHLQSSCNFPVQILAMDVLCYILSVLRRIEGDAAIPYGGLACFIPLAIVS